MKKRFTVITAIILCFAMMFTFASCSGSGDETEEEKFVAAVIDVGDDIPVSEKEIISFYNDIITKLQLEGTFTAETSPVSTLTNHLMLIISMFFHMTNQQVKQQKMQHSMLSTNHQMLSKAESSAVLTLQSPYLLSVI